MQCKKCCKISSTFHVVLKIMITKMPYNCNVHCTGFKKSIVHFEKLFSMHGCSLNNSYPFFTEKSEKYFSFEITQMERKIYASIINYSLPSSWIAIN